ncbi:hypothetical protein [Halomonas caseinilytica]|uniref:Uncharacterized protein n=1 Tax=Halomonas caseinilytica TaxID=438744 RepID=A0A1M6T8U7_9GAMM|nr:hypothetical protein [Halomonas caseinilytica]SHK53168.1 hypothetical protein SAMN05192556_103248 [Halomonas caseinilytica]
MSLIAWIAWGLAGLVILAVFVLGNVWLVMGDMDARGDVHDDD